MGMKTFQYRLYPTKVQVEKLEWTLSRCCELYNAALQERRDVWNVCKKHANFYDAEWRKEHARDYSLTYYDQANALPTLKSEIRPEYLAIGAHVLQDVLKRVDKAFQAFFRRVRAGQTPGYPRYQSSKRYDLFCFPDHAGWKLTDNRLSITNLGTIKVKMHREIQGTIKTCTIKRDGTHWYVAFACEVEAQVKQPLTDIAIGIDLGLKHFMTTSLGDTVENPRFFRLSHGRLKKAQSSLAKKKKGSNRRAKAVKRVATAHRKIRNQRKDFQQKESRILVDTFETIIFEDLSIHHMVKRPKPKQDEETGAYLPNGAAAKSGLNKSMLDAGWGTFIDLVKHKAAWAGAVTVLEVNPHKTSQICSACHKEGEHKDLSIRTHLCAHCGVVLDRDHNASINILDRGLGRSLREPASTGTFRGALREAAGL